MVFRDDGQRFNYLTTRDLNLNVDVKPVLEETFDFGPLARYDFCVAPNFTVIKVQISGPKNCDKV